MIDVVGSPFLLFALTMLVVGVIVRWARRMAPAPPVTGDKTMPYVGGEPFKAALYRPGYEFFTVALFFTLLHVAALVLATVPRGASPWVPLGYLAFVGVAVLALRWEK